ncbi:MAG: hypothetical protein ACFFB3_02615 [Candidatus Hodarchaeota archaeon]
MGILLLQTALYSVKETSAEDTSLSQKEDLVLPLGFTPLILQKPMANASWQGIFQNVTFQRITMTILELKPLPLDGSLETLEVEVIINGHTTTKRYDGSDYSFDAPTQLGLLVDATTRKLDGTTEVQVLLKPHWGLLEAGVQVTLAQLWSFNPRPSFGEGFQRIPLSVNWNSYYIGGIPPLALYFITTGFLGNASGSNQLQFSLYLEILGINTPWVEVFLEKERIYQGKEDHQWINTTVESSQQNWSQFDLTVEYHPHMSADRHKEVIIRLEVYAEFSDYISPQAVERERLLAEIPTIPKVIGNLLILNAIALPLIYFRKKRLEDQEKRKKSQITPEKSSERISCGFLSQNDHDR